MRKSSRTFTVTDAAFVHVKHTFRHLWNENLAVLVSCCSALASLIPLSNKRCLPLLTVCSCGGSGLDQDEFNYRKPPEWSCLACCEGSVDPNRTTVLAEDSAAPQIKTYILVFIETFFSLIVIKQSQLFPRGISNSKVCCHFTCKINILAHIRTCMNIYL